MISREMLMDKTAKGRTIYENWIDIPRNGSMRSPLREDKNPSFYIRPSKTTGEWIWTDYGTKESGSALDFAAHKFGYNLPSDFAKLAQQIWTEILNLPLPENDEQMDKKYFSNEDVLATLGKKNILDDHLSKYAPADRVADALTTYNVGSCKFEQVIFWHTDTNGRHCAKKPTTYRQKEDTITKKRLNGKGADTYFKYASQDQGEQPTLPLFGAHLAKDNSNLPIVVFEGEDQALMAHLKLGGEFLYMACSGPLSSSKFESLEGRTALFAPDLDVLVSTEKMEQLHGTIERVRSLKVKIEIWPLMEQLAPEVKSAFTPEAYKTLDIRDYFEAQQVLASTEVAGG